MALEGEVMNMTGLDNITGMPIFVISVGEIDYKFEIMTLDITGSAGITTSGGVSFVVVLEWKQVCSYASGRLHLSLRCRIAAM